MWSEYGLNVENFEPLHRKCTLLERTAIKLDPGYSLKFFQRVRSWVKQLKRDGVTLWFACKHPKTPWYSKALALFVVGYALSPIDLIPDFVPVLGYLDDVLLLPGLIWLAIYLTPAEVLKECRSQGEEWITHEGRNPRSL